MASDGLVGIRGDMFCMGPFCADDQGCVAAEEEVERWQYDFLNDRRLP